VTKTQYSLQLLRDFESRNITFMAADGGWPMVWERAQGVHVWDAEGKKYLDLTAAFGVAAAGHANPKVVQAGQKQMAKLLHAMGDVHPHALKAALARELSRITFERWAMPAGLKTETAKPKTSKPKAGKVIFASSGFEAVESALKTALLTTGKRGVIAFTGAYHGLGYGALNVTHRKHFRAPFRPQLREFGHFAPFPKCGGCGCLEAKSDVRACSHLRAVEKRLEKILRQGKAGAILVEPVQARGGINIPPPGFLTRLRRLCDEHGALLILDEIYTGFGRTGRWFACEHSGVIPDLICLGKALAGGFPLSACVGRADLMDAAWPVATGEAIHTSTFLGHPVGCAMALAQIKEIEKLKLADRSAELGEFLVEALSKIQSSKYKIEVRGLGLMAGVELNLPGGKPATAAALTAVKTLLHRGYIVLPEGGHGNVISFTPPLTITKAQLAKAVAELQKVLATT
jgi:4-aminobutyrate aminotransferase-like enzyme